MKLWALAALGLLFFGLAWAVDAFLGTRALVVFSGAVLFGPIAVLELVRQFRRSPGDPLSGHA